MSLPPSNFDLIHVGKCAGESVKHELNKAGIKFRPIHVQKPKADRTKRFITLVRDPADRFVSAYNWRKFILSKQALGAGNWPNLKEAWESELLNLYPSANDLIEALNPDDPTVGLHAGISLLHLIGHITIGFSWYLDTLLDEISADQMIAAIAVESASDDLRNLFGIEMKSLANANYPKDTFLSTQSRIKLANIFQGEYRTLRRLASILHAGGGYLPSPLQSYLP